MDAVKNISTNNIFIFAKYYVKHNSMIIAVLISVFLLLFPIFLTINIYTDLEKKRIWFSLYVLHGIKIYGGYVSMYGEGFAFHLTKNKAVLLPFKELINAPNKFKITRGFSVIAFNYVAELGSELGQNMVLAAALLRIASDLFGVYLISKKQCDAYKGDIYFRLGWNNFKISLRAILAFNVLLLFVAAVKIFLQKIWEWSVHERKSKQKSK